jgi:photosystem II stability/assembly factor-like uncharacterized protein
MRRFFMIGFLSVGLLFIGASCTLPFGERGAMLKSANEGKTWASISMMTLGKRKVKIASAVITRIVIDPRNSNRVFMGTASDGLYSSENGGADWFPLLPRETITDVIIDPNAVCTLYVATPASILRTINCAETWEIVLHETRENSMFSSLAIDYYFPNVVYATTIAGDIFRSGDSGLTWSVLYRMQSPIARIILDSKNPSILYAASTEGVIMKSSDKGYTWEEISKPLETYGTSLRYVGLQSLAKTNSILYASESSIFMTQNGGRTWDRIPLLTRPGDVSIRAVATNPTDDREIYYTTENTFYHTDDAGIRWETVPGPARRPIGTLVVDPNNTSLLYAGAADQLRRREGDGAEKYWRFGPEKFRE